MRRREAIERLLVNMMEDGVTDKETEKFETMDAMYFVLDAIGMRGVNNELAHMLNNDELLPAEPEEQLITAMEMYYKRNIFSRLYMRLKKVK